MKKTDKNIYNKRYYRANKVSDEILNAIENDINSADCKEFEKMLTNNIFSNKLLDDMVDADKHKLYYDELKSADKESDIKNLVDNLYSLKRRSARRRIIYGAMSVAAAMIAISFAFLNYGKKENDGKIVLTEVENFNLKEPVLIFETGDTVMIDKQRDYKEYAELMINSRETDSVVNKYNTAIIPVGHTYRLVLADGTNVTLNAGSRLKYPTVFSDSTREVELEGEAYFDVVKSDKKFIVKSSNSKIEVFGTQFNLRSRQNGDVEAVLVEGSIGFKPSAGDMFMIEPGTKLSYVSKYNAINIESVDTYNYTAWMDNKFVYKEQSLMRVMNDIASWYGIKISSLRAVDDLTLTLVISRNTPIDDLMRVISLTLNINIIKEKGMEYTIE